MSSVKPGWVANLGCDAVPLLVYRRGHGPALPPSTGGVP
jgi:hypothetical protein